ncbi:MAG: DedA family protein [Proteobacteria bacterium]|nr:DedA family protein [Pseudomonadota bacterium]MDA1042716.1 DedA family protein [Pseudomonadota bacterium]
MIKALYNWTIDRAAHPNALWFLALISFVESSIFPLPPDFLIIPMVLARPKQAWLIAIIATVASVSGGLFGYVIGAYLFDIIGQPLLDFYGSSAQFDSFSARYNDYGAWAVLIAGVTPFPYKVITILSGATALSLPIFMLASILARGLRFFIIAALLWRYGNQMHSFIEKRLGLLFSIAVALVVIGFLGVKWL